LDFSLCGAAVQLSENTYSRMLRLFEASVDGGDAYQTISLSNAEAGRQLAAVAGLYAEYCKTLRLPLQDCPPAVRQAKLRSELDSITAERLITAHPDGKGTPSWGSALANALERLGRRNWATACRERAARFAPERPDLIEPFETGDQHGDADPRATLRLEKWLDYARIGLVAIRAAVQADAEPEPAARRAPPFASGIDDADTADEEARELSPAQLLTLARSLAERDPSGRFAQIRRDLHVATTALVQRDPEILEYRLAHGYSALALDDRAAAVRSFATASLMARDGISSAPSGQEGNDALAFARAFLANRSVLPGRSRSVWQTDDRLVGLAETAELQRQGDILGALARADAAMAGFFVATPVSFERYKSNKIIRLEAASSHIPELAGIVDRLDTGLARRRYALRHWVLRVGRRALPLVLRFDRDGWIELRARRFADRVRAW
jgi:hypothetical protein